MSSVVTTSKTQEGKVQLCFKSLFCNFNKYHL